MYTRRIYTHAIGWRTTLHGSNALAEGSAMDESFSFGYWVRRRRKALDLTQTDLARRVGCARVTIQKIEANERRPSRQIATLLAEHLRIPHAENSTFLASARGQATAERLARLEAPQAGFSTPPPHNLPAALTSFVGRAHELAMLEPMLSQTRLLTLTGLGGIGKSRLAIQLAQAVLDRFPAGVWLVELASLTDPGLIGPAVAAALGVRGDPGRSLLATIAAFLQSKQLLLVLDNCEHLIDACAQLAADLLRACPYLRLLSSSREPLGVAGEVIFRVPTLRVPDRGQPLTLDQLAQFEAIDLFAERARAVQPAFAVTKTNASALAQICAQLDGIPLAIELAAARVPALMPAQIASRLDDRFRLLTSGSRTALPRHQTLRALIDWSYDLLASEERVLLRRLAVFAGGWALEAAEVVCSFEAEIKAPNTADLLTLPDSRFSVLHALAHLVDKSLVQVDETGLAARYRMLETIRQYALEKLALSGEADELRRRHAEYYLAVGKIEFFGWTWTTPEWLQRTAPEYNNLRAAYAWNQTAAGKPEHALQLSFALCALGYSLGLMSEARAELERSLNQPSTQGMVLAQARFQSALAQLLGSMGYFAEARSHMEGALARFRELGDAWFCGYIAQRLGWLAREQGDARTAWASTEEARALFLELGDVMRAATIDTTQAEIAILDEKPELAVALIERRRAQRHSIDTDIEIAWDMNHLGHAAQLCGDYDRAAAIHAESLARFLDLNKRYVGAIWAYQSLGEAVLGQGDVRAARGWLAQGLVLAQQAHDQPSIAWCLAGLGSAAALGAAPQRAARLWGAAERLRTALGCRPAPATRPTYEQALAKARADLGEAAFELAWEAGQRLPLALAIAEALDT